ncbi:MAG: hypothetical protein GWN30_37200, partial [Gammaproteobacteria bacterium]|nr:hypothetical protein [Gammaproteobacteria bacterium]
MSKPVHAQQVMYDSGGDLTPELAAYNVNFYDLNLKINPADSTVSGFVDIHFDVVQPTNEIAIALDPRLDISSVDRISSDNST